MTLGDRLRGARERKGYTQVGAAQHIGINGKTYHGYENGVGTPSPETLAKIADLYEVSLEYLVKGYEMPKKDPELNDILEEFKRQMEGRPLSDDEKKQVLNTITDVIWQARDKSNNA